MIEKWGIIFERKVSRMWVKNEPKRSRKMAKKWANIAPKQISRQLPKNKHKTSQKEQKKGTKNSFTFQNNQYNLIKCIEWIEIEYKIARRKSFYLVSELS